MEEVWSGNIGSGTIPLANADDYFAFIIYTGQYYMSPNTISAVNTDYPNAIIGSQDHKFSRNVTLSNDSITIGSVYGVDWSDKEIYCRTTKVVGIKK